MKKIELLAPAGDMDALEAAVAAGADAVYIGGNMFSARAFAKNFSNEEIIEAINYCHLYDVKIYITVNTLIFESEIPMFINYIRFLHKSNVDAVILQDIGMTHLVKEKFPNLEVHASTQMHVHNEEGFKVAKKLGVKRVVVPREMSLTTVQNLSENSGLDVEVFVHGALCFSYSGQCLMSYLVGGRSANRGACAGTCRMPFKLYEGDKELDKNGEYNISMKDLSTFEEVGAIIESGAVSLKIEGRMKRKEYVYLVTKVYRIMIDNYYKGIKEKDLSYEKELKKLFNREFTNGYLFDESDVVNNKHSNHIGIIVGKVVANYSHKVDILLSDEVNRLDGIRFNDEESYGFTIHELLKNNKKVETGSKGEIITVITDHNIPINTPVLKTTDKKQLKEVNSSLANEKKQLPIKYEVSGKAGKILKVTAIYKELSVTVTSDAILEKAKNAPISKDMLKKQLGKLGATPYYADSYKFKLEEDFFISVGELNALRRLLISNLTDERMLRKSEFIEKEYKIESVISYEDLLKVKVSVRTEEQLKSLKKYNFIDQIYVSNIDLFDSSKDNQYLELNNVIFNYKDYNFNNIVAAELGSINKYRAPITTSSLNITNSFSVYFLNILGVKAVTLSPETDYLKINSIIKGYQDRYGVKPNLEVDVYKKEYAMTTKYKLQGDKLKDKFGNEYKTITDDETTKILHYEPINMLNEINSLKDIGVRNIKIKFTDENEEEISVVLDKLQEVIR